MNGQNPTDKAELQDAALKMPLPSLEAEGEQSRSDLPADEANSIDAMIDMLARDREGIRSTAPPQPEPEPKPAPAPEPEPTPEPEPEPEPLPKLEPVPAPEPSKPKPLIGEQAEAERLQQLLQAKQQAALLEQAAKAGVYPPQQPSPLPGRQPEDEFRDLAQQYSFNIPPQMLEALRSENPMDASMALQALLASLGATVHQRILQQVQQQVVPELQGSMQQQMQVQTQQTQAREEFYGRYPQLRPYANIVQIVAQQVSQELPHLTSWSPELGDYVAHRTALLLQSYNPQQQQEQQPPVPQVRQPFMAPGSQTRAPVSNTNPNSPEALKDFIRGL